MLIREPKCLVEALRVYEETEWKDHVMKRYGYEHGLPTTDLLDLFPNFAETVEPYSFLEGTSLPIDLALLKALARNYEHCRYLEIGTWRGESVANVASIADQCVSINLSGDEMRQRGLSKEFIDVHRFFSKNFKNISHIGHDSHSFDFSVFKKKFDLIFIDGDHTYKSIKIDTQNAFKLLRNIDSVIVWHDYGFSPERVRWSVLAGILDGCPKEKRKNLFHISNTLCAIYINRNFKTTFTAFPQMPNKSFKVKLCAVKCSDQKGGVV